MIKRYRKLVEEFNLKDSNDYTNFKNGFINGCYNLSLSPTSYANSSSLNEKMKSKGSKKHNSPRKETAYGKDIGRDNEETLAMKIDNTNKQFSKKSEPKYAFCSMCYFYGLFWS